MSLILLKDFLKLTSVKDCNSSIDKNTRLDRLKFIEKPSKGLWLIYRCFIQIFMILGLMKLKNKNLVEMGNQARKLIVEKFDNKIFFSPDNGFFSTYKTSKNQDFLYFLIE